MKICPQCGRFGIDDSYMVGEEPHCLWRDCLYKSYGGKMTKKLVSDCCGADLSLEVWCIDENGDEYFPLKGKRSQEDAEKELWICLDCTHPCTPVSPQGVDIGAREKEGEDESHDS